MIHEFTLAANASKTLPGGHNIELMEADHLVAVDLLGANGNRIEQAENVPASWYYRQAIWSAVPAVQGVKITAGANGATVKVSISGGNSGVNTITGEVTVENLPRSSTADTLNGSQYIGEGTLAGAAALYAGVQIWNPAGSGKILVVNRADWLASTPANVLLTRMYSTELLTLYANGRNKNAGGAAGVAKIKTEQLVSPVVGTAVVRIQWPVVEMLKRAPIVIGEGNGLMATNTVVNDGVYGIFEWEEIDS